MGEDVELFRLSMDGRLSLPQFQEQPLESIPATVLKEVEQEQIIQKVTSSSLIKTPLFLDFGEGGNAYILIYQQERNNPYQETYYGVYEVDINKEGSLMGFAVSLLELSGAEKDKPFVQFTQNKHGFHHRGLAIRRLIVLNEVNKSLFNLPLYSGSFLTAEPEPGEEPGIPSAEKTWLSLEEAGLAIKLGDQSYRFK